MADGGKVVIKINADTGQYTSAINNLENVTKKSSIASKLSVVAIGTALVGAGKYAIGLASNLQEVQNVVDTTFSTMSEDVNKFAEDAKTSFGVGELQAKQFTGTLGAMIKSMGVSEEETYKMSTSMVRLAGDFASFYNLDHQTSFEKIRAGIAGETEPLKQLGINMSVANLEAFALSEGISKAYKEMTQAEQTTLRYNYLMSVSADAQGDFARTSEGFANQLRIAKLEVDEFAAELGKKLLPTANKVLTGTTKIFKTSTQYISNNLDDIAYGVKLVGAAWLTWKSVNTAVQVTKKINSLLQAQKNLQKLVSIALAGDSTARVLNNKVKELGYTIDAKGNILKASGVALTNAETTALLGSTGALSGKSIAVGVLTGNITLATAAQYAWNTAMNLNPAVLATTAVVGLGTAIWGISEAINNNSDDVKQLTSDVEGYGNTLDETTTRLSESKTEFDKNQVVIDNMAGSAKSAVDEVRRLADANDGSKVAVIRLNTAIQKANEIIPELSLAYNDQTGEVENLNKATDEYIDTFVQSIRIESQRERLTKLVKEQVEAEENLAIVQAKKLELLEKEPQIAQKAAAGVINPGVAVLNLLDNQISAYKDLAEQESTYSKLIESTKEEIELYTGIIGENTEAVEENVDTKEEQIALITAEGDSVEDLAKKYGTTTEAIRTQLEEQGITFDQWAVAAEEADRRAKESRQNLADAYYTANEKINLSDQISLEKRIENLKANQDLVNNYKANMETILAASSDGGVKLNDELLKILESSTPEAMAIAQQLVTSFGDGVTPNVEMLEKLNSAYTSMGEGIPTDIETGITNNEQVVLDKSSELVTSAYDSASTENSATDWKGLGNDAADGYAEGIKEKASQAAQEAANMVKNAIEAAKEAQKSSSPSKITRGLGKDNADGFALGIRDRIDNVKKVSEDMVNESLMTTRKSLSDRVSGVFGNPLDLVNMQLSDSARSMNSKSYSGISRGSQNSEVMTVNNEFVFNQPIETPDSVARQVNKVIRSGLAGSRE